MPKAVHKNKNYGGGFERHPTISFKRRHSTHIDQNSKITSEKVDVSHFSSHLLIYFWSKWYKSVTVYIKSGTLAPWWCHKVHHIKTL